MHLFIFEINVNVRFEIRDSSYKSIKETPKEYKMFYIFRR
jgi:hypothetical protein